MKNSDTTTNLLGFKVLIVLYSVICLIPRFEAIDPIGSQWVYFGLLDVLGLFFILKNRNSIDLTVRGRSPKLFFLAYSLFTLIALASAAVAMNFSEWLKDIARIIITLVAAVNMFFIFRVAPQRLFAFLTKLAHVVVLIIGVQVVFHFVSHWGEPLKGSLLKGSELLFGSRNVTAAALISFVPFLLWGTVHYDKKWKIASLLGILLAIASIYYANARTALLSGSVIILLFVVYVVVDGRRSQTLSRKLKNTILPVVLAVSLGLGLVRTSNPEAGNKTVDALEVSEEVSATSSIAAYADKIDSGRLLYYEVAIDDFKENPLLGLGLGNWKLADKDKFFANYTKDSFLYPLRVHDDFLQVLAELGIIGFLFYFIMFIVIGVTILSLFFNNQQSEARWMYLVLGFCFIAYVFDALLNFPMERTPMQVVFAILAALTMAFMEENTREGKVLTTSIPILMGLGVIAVAGTAISFTKYQSYVHQNYILADTMGKNLMTANYTYTYSQAKNRLDGFYEIAGVGRPNEHVMAMYAMSEGNDKLALTHLDKSIALAPNHYESKMLKAIIYGQREKNLDSAIYYAKQGFEKYPAIKNNYILLLNAYHEKGDTVNYFKTYDARLERFPNDVKQWKAKATRVFEYYKDADKAMAVVNDAIKANPSDSSLSKFGERFTSRKREVDIRSWYKKGFDLIKENNYFAAKEEFLKILEVTPSNNPTLLNLGIIEIKMKQYEASAQHLTKVIESNAFADGRPEYNRGLAYERLGETEKSKRDYRVSKRKGYALAQKLPKSKLE